MDPNKHIDGVDILIVTSAGVAGAERGVQRDGRVGAAAAPALPRTPGTAPGEPRLHCYPTSLSWQVDTGQLSEPIYQNQGQILAQQQQEPIYQVGQQAKILTHMLSDSLSAHRCKWLIVVRLLPVVGALCRSFEQAD